MKTKAGRRKYGVDSSFYENLLTTAYKEIEAQTGVVLTALEKFINSGEERSVVWADLQSYVEKREWFCVNTKLMRLLEQEYHTVMRLFHTMMERRKKVLESYGLWDKENEQQRKWGEKRKENFDWSVIKEMEAVMEDTRERVYGGLLKAVGSECARNEVWQLVEKLAGLRERYTAGEQLLDFTMLEYTAGNELIDMVMVKRLGVVLEFGILEEKRDGGD